MGALCSKFWFSVPRTSHPPSDPRSPPAASALPNEKRYGAGGSSGILDCIPPSETAGAGSLGMSLRSALPEDGGYAERIEDVSNGGVRDTALLNDDGQSQLPIAVRFEEVGSGGVPDTALLNDDGQSQLPIAVRFEEVGSGGVPDTALLNGDGQSQLPIAVRFEEVGSGGVPDTALLNGDGQSQLPIAVRFEEVGSGGVPDTALLNDDGLSQLPFVEPESRLFSCQPLGAASDTVPGPSGSVHGVLPQRLFKLDEAKHKIFLSHSGAQKDFVEQMCVDLECKGYFFPFFDQRHHCLPKGEDFAPLIIKAAQLCHVAVIVLSKEFLCSKWPMIELAEFYATQQGARGGGGKLKLLPLFFKLSIEEVKDEDRWMPKWKEHAKCDGRIDLSKWSAAVKALCKSNGLEFGKVATTEVTYRKCIIESIFKLSPPTLLFGCSKSMVGSSRMCEAMSRQFVEDTTIGARVLEVYGMVGLGKSRLAKALHDYFYGEFLGKVCYVNMGYKSRAWRQKRVLKMLCGFEKNMLGYIGADVEKGLEQMKTFMKRDPVFLVLDNITNNAHLLQEVQDYLTVGFHKMSRILITSSSKAILEELLPNMEFYTQMPTLMVEEARALFLKFAAPMKAISGLTSEEHNILGICVKNCWFSSQEGGFYHPMVLTTLADFFSRLGRATKNQLLVWKDRLEKEVDLVKDILKTSKSLFDILNSRFSTFDFREKLIFLDLALYSGDPNYLWEGSSYQASDIGWLCRLHGESPTIIERKLLDLRKSGMIDFDFPGSMDIVVPPMYQEFAKWYATDHDVNELKTAWGVFQLGGMNLRSDSCTPIKSWSNLIRLRISPMTRANARLVASKRMQELRNLVVLQLVNCHDLTSLNLEGFDRLREVELTDLSKLETITLLGNSSKDEYPSIYDSLQHVQLRNLVSLIHMPNFTPCTSLHSVVMKSFEVVRNLEGANCPCVKNLTLNDVSPNHFERLLDFHCLQSLEYLWIDAESEGEYFEAQWRQRVDESNTSVQVALEGEGPCAKLLKELCLLLNRSNNMICTRFVERSIY